MTSTLALSGLEGFRFLVADRFGLSFDSPKLDLLSGLLCKRAETMSCSVEGYLENLASPDRSRAEWNFLASELTVPETYFFRHIEQLRALVEIVLPERLQSKTSSAPLRVLVAGCASGEEPYTIAMLIRTYFPDLGEGDVEIQAVDINPAMIRHAKRGRYCPWSLREMPADMKRRWFRSEGREFRLDGSIHEMVTFREGNLVQEDPSFWKTDFYDVIFCRNVIMYFTPGKAKDAISRVARAMTSGGYLFLGHAETLRELSNDFHLCHSHDAFYYRRKTSLDSASTDGSISDALTPSHDSLENHAGSSDTWIETIQRASGRIYALPLRATDEALSESPAQTLAKAMELFQAERYQDVLAILQDMPAHAPDSPKVLLLRAAVLTQSGNQTAAERACQALIEMDELNAGAHHLLALCFEAAGDYQGAVAENKIASYIDPGFALPHFHLGLLARRAGDTNGACTELGKALALLHQEDASRLLLYCGGFTRDTLLALCRAELHACGDPSSS